MTAMRDTRPGATAIPNQPANGAERLPVVLVCDDIAEDGLRLFEGQAEVVVKTGLKGGDLLDAVADCDALLVRSQTKVTAEVIAAAKRLRIIGRAGVGVDNIDVPAATSRGIIVVNSPMAVNIAAAEHALALMLSLARNVPQGNASLRDGRWDRSKFLGVEVRGKTLGVIGLGNIGSEFARRGAALEMRVLGYDPYVSAEVASRLGVELADVDAILKEADFVSVHVPLTEKTRGLIGERELAIAKPGIRLINCARGGIIDEAALLKALEDGRVAGAALDVFTQEPPIGNPLVSHPRVVVTPHLGASTEEAQVNAAIQVTQQVVAVLGGQPARFAVNVPSIRPEVMTELEPYLGLAEALGDLLARLHDGQVACVEIGYSGDAANFDTALLRAAALKGILGRALLERINLVNAQLVARNRGIQVIETKSGQPAENYTNLISVRVVGRGGRLKLGGSQVSGTLVNGVVHIVGVNGYRMDIVPSGDYVLFCHYKDRPGVIGRIGTLLGERSVNISFMQVGRREARGEAMMVLGLDEDVSGDSQLFGQILEAGDVQHAQLVKL